MITTVLLASTLVACVATPTKQSSSQPNAEAQDSIGISGAVAMYNTRNYSGAVKEFDNIIRGDGSSANSRRMAHLGKAMVYLGNDENWHSIENAKMALISAGQVAPQDGEKFAVETDLLMDAVSEVIGTESKYSVLKAKSSGSGQQIAKLSRELDAVYVERNELLEERKMLNVALEKLKELTLGN